MGSAPQTRASNSLRNISELLMLCSELLVHGFETDGIELGFEAKMPDAALELKHFQFGVG